jgi:hypothetical protein
LGWEETRDGLLSEPGVLRKAEEGRKYFGRAPFVEMWNLGKAEGEREIEPRNAGSERALKAF